MYRQKKQIITLIIVALITLTSSSALASVPSGDAYHNWFQQQMQTEYGLAGGTWLFTDSEHLNLVDMWSQAPTTTIPVQNMPFTQAVRVNVAEQTKVPWEIGMGLITRQPIAAGDKILISFWIKNNWAEKDGGYVRASFQDITTFETAVMYPALPNQEWTQYFMATTAKQHYPAGGAGLYLMVGTQLQEFELGGVTAVNFGQTVAQETLPQSTLGNYTGQEPDAPWRAEAAERIEQLRRGDLTINVVDAAGNPLPNANVHVIMRSHGFDFGTALRAEHILRDTPNDQIYRDKLTNLDGRGNGFNLGVVEYALQWEPWEGEIDLGFSQEQIVSAVDWLRAQEMALRGHSLIWPRWSSLPDDIVANQHNPAYVRQRMENRITEMLTHPGLAGKFEEWDVLNEPRFNTDIASIFAGQPGYTTGEEIYAELHNKAAEIDPNVKLALNEYNVLNEAGMFIGVQKHMHQILTDLINNGGKIDRIGLQTHMSYPFTPPERLYELLDEFAVYDKELRITEFEILIEDEAKAGQYMHDFLTVLYSHPAATGIVLWNFWDGSHWDGNAPLYRQDWTLKPSGQSYIDLVYNQWWTDETGITDGDGQYSVRGYTGDYLIEVIGPNGLAKTAKVTLDNTGNEITIVVDQQRLFLPIVVR
ncbi:MAG: endo-1,4-beta-xylanase [Chloroflexota bacterium]